jgi:hypothetical protein
VRVSVDTRDPWARFLPEGWELVRENLETGDLVLSALPESAVVERKTASDMARCIGAERDRFEKELKRGRGALSLGLIHYHLSSFEYPDCVYRLRGGPHR